MRLIISFLTLLTMVLNAHANNGLLPSHIKIHWQLVTNNYQQQNQFLATITLVNQHSQAKIPTHGWHLYFNGFKDAVVKQPGAGLEVYRVQGDLFCIVPTAEFSGIAPGDSVIFNFIGQGWVFNISDAPTGFYWVWDSEPQTAFNVTNVITSGPADIAKFSREAGKAPDHVTPGQVYQANKSIAHVPANMVQQVVPTPVLFTSSKGVFSINKKTCIVADSNFNSEASYLATELEPFLKHKLPMGMATQNAIILKTNASIANQGYELNVTPNYIQISASGPAGIFYGIQSLKSLLPLNSWQSPQAQLPINGCHITDYPRFGYRGLHLDVARNFQTKTQVFKLLNYMAMYKLNVLHLHLTEDEAWRIEIPGLPELTNIGAKRGHTTDNKHNMPPAYGSGANVNNPQSGYYTRADYIEILQFAKSRHIQVIPEIETPGHARAAIKAMESRYEQLLAQGKNIEASAFLLSDLHDKSVYRSAQYFSDNVMCVALPSVYKFIETVTDALIAMHLEAGMPLKTIHLGGDEVPSGTWEKSPLCQALIASLGNKNLAQTSDLWLYFWAKVDTLLKNRGLYLSGWEEIGMRHTLRHGQPTMIVNPELANKGFHTYVWNTVIGWGAEDLPYRLANGGYNVVLCPVTHLYFDLAYQNHFDEPGQYWGGFNDLEQPFSFIPFHYLKNLKTDGFNQPISTDALLGKDHLTDYGKTNIVGIQGQLWSENIRTPAQLEYFALPKMLALAERAWAANPQWAIENDPLKSGELYQMAWSQFVSALGHRELVKLAYYQGGAGFRIPTVGAILHNGQVWANLQLPGLVIRYTTNGTEPTPQSTEYVSPINHKGIIKLRAFDATGRGGRTIEIENK
jgi:hexosaminidase